jgi:hypothetical protein
MKWILFGMSLVAILQGCGAESEMAAKSKLNAPLRQRLADLSAMHSSQELVVFLKSSRSLDSQSRKALAGAGVHIIGEAGQILTARIASDSIMSVARLGFVSSIELSLESKALPK